MFGWYGKKKTDRKQAHVVLAQQTHAAIEGDRCERVLMGNSVPKWDRWLCRREVCFVCCCQNKGPKLKEQLAVFTSMKHMYKQCSSAGLLSFKTKKPNMS